MVDFEKKDRKSQWELPQYESAELSMMAFKN